MTIQSFKAINNGWNQFFHNLIQFCSLLFLSLFPSNPRETWWFKLSAMEATSITGGQISSASEICCKSFDFRKILTKADYEARNENHAYCVWERQYQVLLTWLQSMLSLSILSRVLGNNHFYQVREKIHEYFINKPAGRLDSFKQSCAQRILKITPCLSFSFASKL